MPIYSVRGPDGRIYDIKGPEGATEQQILNAARGFYAQQQREELYRPEPVAPPQPEPPSTKRTTTEALVQDPAASLVSGIGKLAQFPGQLYGLVSGDMDTVLSKPGRAIEEFGQRMKSSGLVAREQERARKIQEAEEQSGQMSAFGTALKETVTDPALLPSFLIEQAPNLIPALAMTKAAKGLALAKAASAGVAKDEAERIASRAGVKAALATAAVQQGADIGAGAYEQIYDVLVKQGLSKEDAAVEAINSARAAGASGAVISLLSQKLPGAQAFERAIAGVPGAGSRAGLIGRGIVGESAQEIVEETGGRFTQNIALRDFAPETSLTAGLGEAAAMATIGGGTLGGISGALRRREEPTPPEPKVEPVQEPLKLEPPPISAAPPEPPKVEPVPPKVEPVATEPKVEPVAPVKPPEFTGYETGLPEESKDIFEVLQNRNRSTPASIKQMQGIASDPDYGRLKVSPDFAAGAPVVISDTVIDEPRMGRIDTMTASDGRKIPVRYAVIEAESLLPSHTADGRTNSQYGDMSVEAIRAVAGNGRIAGLQAAYGKGTAENYKNSLLQDLEHGIGREVIEGMTNPVLVRVMPKSYVTPNIGDISNVSGTLRLNPVETAKNDLKRIDLAGIDFNEDGTFNDASLMQFVQGMPIDEQGELLDDKGRPNSKAIDRLNNAIFLKAYNSDALIDLYAQAADPEAKLVLSALARAASKVSRLEGGGEYDIRKNIIDAAEQAVNAKRQGVALAKFAAQRDISIDDNTYAIMQMMAENSRSGKRMGELLGELADKAFEQTQVEPDMFGDAPKLPLAEVFKTIKVEPSEPKPPKPAEPKKPKVELKPESFEISTPMEDIAKEISGMSMVQLSQWAVNNAPNDYLKQLMKKVDNKILAYNKEGIFTEPVKVINGKNSLSGWRGRAEYAYSPLGLSRRVKFKGVGPSGKAHSKTGTRYSVIAHELLHTVTHLELTINPDGALAKELSQLAKIARKQFELELKKTTDQHPIVSIVGTTNARMNYVFEPAELITWGLTKPPVVDFLSKIKYKDTNVFSAIIDALRDFLGLDQKYESVLEAIARVSENIIDTPMDQIEQQLAAKGIPLQPLPKQAKRREIVTTEGAEEVPIKQTIAKGKAAVSAALQKRRIPAESMKDMDPEIIALAQPIFFPQHKTILDRLDAMRDGFWKKLAQGIADEYRTIKEYSEEAYMLARLSKSFDGALEGLLFHGHIFDDGGALNIKKNTTGMIEAMKPLGNEVDRYQMWIALNREANLPDEKRSKIENMDELVARRSEFSEGTVNGRPRIEVYNEVREKLNALNRSVLTVAKDKGLIESSQDEINRIKEGRQPTPKDRMILSEPIEKRIELLKEQMDEIADTDADAKDLRQVIKDQLAPLRQRLREINKAEKWSGGEQAQLIEWYTDHPGAYERFTSDIWYIPFYREMEDGDVSSVRAAAGLPNQKFSKALEGGASPFGDLMENVLRNWSHILSASLKNGAAVATMKAAEPLGGVEPNLKKQYYLIDGKAHYQSNDEMVGDGTVQPWMTTGEGKGIAKVMVDGYPMHFKVVDPMLLESIMSIGYMGPKSKFLDISRTLKNWLQFGVTISPVFRTNNLIRDSISAMGVTELKKNPVFNVLTGINSAKQGDDDFIAATSGGAVFNFGTVYEGDSAELVKRLIAKGVPENTILTTPDQVKQGLKLAWDKYQEWGNRMESANRLALYKQLREEGMSHLEATYRARDLLDFSMQGAWGSWRLLTQTVPFLNARVQGLYKLGRDGIAPTTRVLYNTITGQEINQTDRQKAISFSIVTGATTFATLALYLAFMGDEEFQKRDDWDRDNFWWYKLPGMEYALRVPKPFEIGAIATLAERTVEQIIDQGSEGKQFKDSLSRMLFDTFAFNLPQVFKPLVDLYSNKDSFTGAPIETAGMERLSKAERYSDNTSALAKLLGGTANLALPEKAEISPVQMDYAIKAYFGWLGGTIAWMSSYAVQPFKDGAYPSQKWVDRASLGYLRELPATQSRYVNSFYEYNKKFSQSLSDMRHYAEIGQAEKVQAILEEKGDQIGMAKFYDKTSKNMANIRSQIRVITNDPDLSASEKKESIDRLKLLLSDLAQQAEEARKEMKR